VDAEHVVKIGREGLDTPEAFVFLPVLM